MSTTSQKQRKLIRVSLYILCLFLFQETLIRVCFPLPELQNLDRVHYKYLRKGSHSLPHLRNRDHYWQSALDTNIVFTHEMNSYGFRGKEWLIEKKENTKRYIFFGDSFTEGIMANQNETIPEGFLKAATLPNIEVFNAGMLGLNLDAYLQLSTDLIPIYKPDAIFICIYANDLGKEEPLIPELVLEPDYYNTLKPRAIELLQQAKKRGPIPFRWSAKKYSYTFNAQNEHSPWHKNEKELTPHVDPEVIPYMKNGTFIPFKTNAFLREERQYKQPAKLGDAIPYIKYLTDKYKVEPIIVYIPARNQVTKHYYPFEKKFCVLKCSDTMDLTQPEYNKHRITLAKECHKIRYSIY